MMHGGVGFSFRAVERRHVFGGIGPRAIVGVMANVSRRCADDTSLNINSTSENTERNADAAVLALRQLPRRFRGDVGPDATLRPMR